MKIVPLIWCVFAAPQEENRVDSFVEAKLKDVQAAGPCDEPEFLRRATLDLTGVVPKVEEVKAYRAEPDRSKLVRRLLWSEDFAAWWGRFLLELTTERRAARYDEHNGRHLYGWLKEQVQKNRPCDAIVRDLIEAEGNMEEKPAVNFLLRYNVRPSDLTGAVGRAFLGTKLQCAQCHDHPFDRWTLEDFWGVAAFFARTKRYTVEDSDVVGATDVRRGKMHLPDGSEEEPINPEKPRIVVKPHWLTAAEPAPGGSRAELAKHVTSDPLFAKNLVNRVWARLMGRGMVEPLDGFGRSAKPSHPELLESLSMFFVKSGHDLRALLGLLVASKTYQRSCRVSSEIDPRLYGRALVRPLTTDQLFLSLVRATRYGVDEDGSGGPEPGEGMEQDEDAVFDYQDFTPVQLLGGSSRSLRQALALLNHGEIHGAVDSGARFIMKVLGKPVTTEHCEYVYLALLSRLPTGEERRHFEGRNKRSDLEDVLWAVINSVEFRNNH